MPGVGVVRADVLRASIGRRWSVGGRSFLVLTPAIRDTVASMRRQAQIIGLKDAATLVWNCDLKAADFVVEVGAGSGALTLVLAQAVGPDGRVVTYDMRADFLDVARANVSNAGFEGRVEFKLGDARSGIAEREADACVLDIPDPWEAIASEPHRRRVASWAVRRDSNGGNYRTRDHRGRGRDPPVLRTARAHGVSVVRAESARHLLISGVVWPPGHGLRSHDVRHHDVRRDLRDRQSDRGDDVLRRPDARLPEDDEDAGDPEGGPRGDDRPPCLRARRELHLPPVRHIDPGVPGRGRDPLILDRVLDDAGRAVADAAHAPGPPGGARARGGRRGAPGHPDARRSRRKSLCGRASERRSRTRNSRQREADPCSTRSRHGRRQLCAACAGRA